MGETIRARVKRGVLEPLEKVDLPEGKEVLVTIMRIPAEGNRDAFRRAFGRWKGTIDAEALIRNIYADRLISTNRPPSAPLEGSQYLDSGKWTEHGNRPK
ncbi:MAG: antitoxin family protein [Terriglobia bacterium]|jgi:predicted DNA-binding antitoxin AbrB/MazE fold protein